jgi:rhodanese-related sulfurtransferase
MNILSPKQLKQMLSKNQVILIDVREPFEHQAESIEGACLLPLAQLSCKTLPKERKAIVVHCLKGVRSAQAATKLLDENPQLEVYSLEGGLMAWKEAGFPTHRASCSVLGLERQTQITAGSLVLAGVLLGAGWHPAFLWLSGFVGAGLIFAGVTGWCGMAKILAKMPWNQ